MRPPPGNRLEGLAQLAFLNPGRHGHPGQSSQISDGASAMLMMSAEKPRPWPHLPSPVQRHGAGWRGPVHGLRPGALDPEGAEEAGGLTIDDIDMVDFNEAFAAQALPVLSGSGPAGQDGRR